MDPRLRALANQLDPMTPAQIEGSARTVADARAREVAAGAVNAANAVPEVLREALVDPAASAAMNVYEGNYGQAALDAAPLIAGAVAGPAAGLAARGVASPVAAAIANALRAGGGKVGDVAARGAAAAAPAVAGVAGALGTDAAINAAVSSELPNIPDLSKGGEPEAIEAAQQELKKLGLYKGSIDRNWGGGTHAAWEKLQVMRAQEMAAKRQAAAEAEATKAKAAADLEAAKMAAEAAKLKNQAAANTPEALAQRRATEKAKAEAELARAGIAERAQARELQERKDALLGEAKQELAGEPIPGSETKEAVAKYGPAFFGAAGAGGEMADAVIKKLRADSLNVEADNYTTGGRPNMRTNNSVQKGFVEAYDKAQKTPGIAKALKVVGYPAAGAEYLMASDAIGKLEKERDRLQAKFDKGTGKKYEALELEAIKKQLEQAQALSTSAIYNAIGLTGGSMAGKAVGKMAMPGATSAAADVIAGAFKDNLAGQAAKAAEKAAGRSIPGRLMKAIIKRIGGSGKAAAKAPAKKAPAKKAASKKSAPDKPAAKKSAPAKKAPAKRAAAKKPAGAAKKMAPAKQASAEQKAEQVRQLMLDLK